LRAMSLISMSLISIKAAPPGKRPEETCKGASGALPAANRGSALQDDDGLSEEAIEAALKQTPRGAFALAGLTVGLLMAAWFAIYLLIFLPRGSVG